ncbi:MAG TPA: HDIG domain-containing protein [Solirubrobacteraceae bacterium]|nr:HDIG domain-containing protein [Solirubrobacteraceae bacterium]
MSEALAALASIVEDDAWLVGGALRDRLLGRPTADYDVVVRGDPRALARALGRRAGGHPFALSEGFGAWRVIARDRSWQVDLLPLVGGSITTDLAARDLTINAIAEPVAGGDYVDPFGGLSDLQARRIRMVSAHAFEDDPLRAIRVVRLACELGFEIEPNTAAAARASAPGLARVAVERTFAEFRRIMVAERALSGLELMDELGITAIVLPELSRLRGVEQSPYHHLDVHDHTLAVLAETIGLVREPERWFPEDASAVSAVLAEPLAQELTRGQALRFGALFHDVAKPQTRKVTAEGRVTFIGHDETGAEVTAAVLARMRAGERLCEHVAALARHHLRLGFLVHEMPLSRRTVYRYLRACEPVGVDVTLLSVADRLATRGRGSEQAISRHVELARQLLGEALAWRAERPRPPLRGDQLARAVGLRPGPEIGRLLDELEEATFAGEIHTPEEAIERAQRLLGSERPGPR